MMQNRVGVIGLGQIGGSITKRLLEVGYTVYVYDILKEKKEEAKQYGAKQVENVKELVQEVQTIIVSLPNDKAIRSIFFDEESFEGNNNLTIIEISTVLPNTIQEIEKTLSKKNVKLIDCPISGGPKEAINGELHLIVSGREDIYDGVKPLLSNIGSNIHYFSDSVGEAKALKLINNIMTLGNVLVAASSFSLGIKSGMDTQKLYDILSKTGGTSHHFVKRFPKVIERDYSSLFSIDLGLKDLGLALKWSNIEGFNTEITEMLFKFYKRAVDQGLGNEDIVAVIKYFLENNISITN